MSNKELYSKINELEATKTEIDRLQAQADTLTDKIKAELAKRNVDVLDTGRVTVTYKTVASARLDSKALKAAHPKIYAQFTNTSETRRFTVKANKFTADTAPNLKVVSAA